MCDRLTDQSVIKQYTTKYQRAIKYFDDLKSESALKLVSITYLRILTQPAMQQLRTILGSGIGIGSTQYKPSKSRPLQYCTLNSTLTSVECPRELPDELRRKPLKISYGNGIEFLYSQQNSTLNCHIRFSRLKISSEDVATSRVPSAIVREENGGAYEGAWFHYDGNTYLVRQIVDRVCHCHLVEDDSAVLDLPLDLINELVRNFGE